MANTTYTPRLQTKYRTEVISALQKKFNYKSVMQVPRLVKICLNQGINGAVGDKKLVDIAVNDPYLRSESDRYFIQEGYFQLQTQKEYANRCPCDTAWL